MQNNIQCHIMGIAYNRTKGVRDRTTGCNDAFITLRVWNQSQVCINNNELSSLKYKQICKDLRNLNI